MRSKRRRTKREVAGFSSVEVLTATTILLLSLTAFLEASTLGLVHHATRRDADAMVEGVRAQMERIAEVPATHVFATYNAIGADDPDGPGTAPGPNFAIQGLRVCPDDADGFVGRIVLPTGGVGGVELRENVVNPALATPRDLNLDGVIDALNHALDYRLIPILVQVEWMSAGRKRTYDVGTVVSEVDP